MFLKKIKELSIVGSFFCVASSQCFFDFGKNITNTVANDSIEHFGTTVLNNIKTGSIKIFGSASGANIEAGRIEIAGNALLKDVIARQLQVAGSSELEEGNITLFNGSGFTTLKKMNIHRAVIAGACSILFSKIDSLNVDGKVSIDKSEIEGDCLFSGQATIKDSTIGGSIIFQEPDTSNSKTYSHGSQGNFTITRLYRDTVIVQTRPRLIFDGVVVETEERKPSMSLMEQVITLDGATHVKGDITFKSGKGKVYKGPHVLITGEIIGAQVFNK